MKAQAIAALALGALQALSLWILTDLRTEIRAARTEAAATVRVVVAVAQWASEKGYKGPRGG